MEWNSPLIVGVSFKFYFVSHDMTVLKTTPWNSLLKLALLGCSRYWLPFAHTTLSLSLSLYIYIYIYIYSIRPRKDVILVFREVKQFQLWLNLCKKYKHLWYKISTIRLFIEYVFIINLFRNINANNICYKLGETLVSLTDTHPIITLFCRRGSTHYTEYTHRQ
jgi:hypothetical protein